MADFLELPPAAVLDRLSRYEAQNERVLIRVASDLDLNLNFGNQWLVVTDQRVLVVQPEHSDELVDLPLTRIESSTLETVVGGGRLVLRSREGRHVVVCFTNAALGKFAQVVGAIV